MMLLSEAMRERERHRREVRGSRCVVCGQDHPCPQWRRARAVVLVRVRRAFTAARSGGPR